MARRKGTKRGKSQASSDRESPLRDGPSYKGDDEHVDSDVQRVVGAFLETVRELANSVEEFTYSLFGPDCREVALKEFFVRKENREVPLGPIETTLFQHWFFFIWSPLCNPSYVNSEIARKIEEKSSALIMLGSLAEIWKLWAEPELSSDQEHLLGELSSHLLKYYVIHRIISEAEIEVEDVFSGERFEVIAPHLADPKCSGMILFGQIVEFGGYSLVPCAGTLLLPGDLREDFDRFHASIIEAISSHPSLQEQLKEPGNADMLALFHGAPYYRDLYFRAALQFYPCLDFDDSGMDDVDESGMIH